MGGTSIATFLSETAGTCQPAMLMCLAKPRCLPRGDMAVHWLMPGIGMLHCELGVFSKHEKALRILSLRCDADHSRQSTANEQRKGSDEWEVFLACGVSQEEASVQ